MITQISIPLWLQELKLLREKEMKGMSHFITSIIINKIPYLKLNLKELLNMEKDSDFNQDYRLLIQEILLRKFSKHLTLKKLTELCESQHSHISILAREKVVIVFPNSKITNKIFENNKKQKENKEREIQRFFQTHFPKN